MKSFLIILILVIIPNWDAVKPQALIPVIQFDHFVHASFILKFDSEIGGLIDYARSNLYGLTSLIYGLNKFMPDYILYSNQHANCTGGEIPEGIKYIKKR